MKLILASGSFLKNYIMDKSRLPYEVKPADIDETIYDHLEVSERVVALAKDKCRVVAERYPDAIVIAADTLTASASGHVFSKPAPGQDPIEAALQLSGAHISVFTGCCVYVPSDGYEAKLSSGEIVYQQFDRATLERLAEDDNPQIRSGALGVFVDAPGFTLIESIRGSYTGIFGLPMEFVYNRLRFAEQKDKI